MSTLEPTWNDDIKQLFSAPFWLPESQRGPVGQGWRGCMNPYQIDLGSYQSVKTWGITIYNHLHSQNMPLTTDHTQMWPPEALEQLRAWVNQGYRETADSPFDRADRIPAPSPPAIELRIRRNILDLDQDELDLYRSKLDDILHVADPSPDSPWQRLAYIHTDWCVHYQESFLAWHRAYLLYLESLIDFPIPYWDFMAESVTDPLSPDGGLPKAFRDETYVHPGTGAVRPNPLRYAAAKDGSSKACVAGNPGPKECCPGVSVDIDCKWVQRDCVLYTTGKDCLEQRRDKLALLELYQQQVLHALELDVFSTPQGYPGFPWANILSFDPPPPDSDYPYLGQTFDGTYEQPHDNFHGWLGPDMADNAYTAFDPVFWSYHANIDRIFELWKRNNPAAQYTAPFIVRPFLGQTADAIDFTDPRQFRFTSIGDMAKDSRALGYDFGPSRDTLAIPRGDDDDQRARPYVVFDGVRCTHDSYTIDVFLNADDPQPRDVRADNPHYVGRFTRLGMGVEDDKGRCIKQGVRRVLDAQASARRLELGEADELRLSLLVTDLAKDRVVSEPEYAALPGFVPRLVWARPLPRRARPSPCSGGGCPTASS